MTKRPPGARIATDLILLWLACAIALGAGYYLNFSLLETAIETQHQLADRVWDLREAQSRTLATRPQLEREERELDEHLRALELRADQPTLAARFIRATTRIAGAHHVNVDGVDERMPAAARRPGDLFAFEQIPLDVSLSGDYAALLATLTDLARAPVSMQIDIAGFERDPSDPGAASENGALTARLHIALQRLTDAAPVAPAMPKFQEEATDARPI